MYLRDGFPGQLLHVLPRPLVREALQRPPTRRLLVTDAGYFPHAARHGRVRPAGAAQAIVILCAAGAGWCELRGVRHDVKAGEVVIIPPREAHSYFASDDDPWSIWWLHVAGDDVLDLLDAIGLTADEPVGPIADLPEATALVENVCVHLDRDETSATLTAAAGAAWHLLANLADGRSADNSPIERAQAHLREHLADPVVVPRLAELVGLSPSHLSARFRAVTGFSVLEYVKRLRMARARQLLMTTTRTIADIALDVGYADPFYFSRQFRQVNGVAPRHFRTSGAGEVGQTRR